MQQHIRRCVVLMLSLTVLATAAAGAAADETGGSKPDTEGTAASEPAATGSVSDRPLSLSATAEIGFLRALHHIIQIGEEGYRFDYVEEGGQEILLPYSRFEVDAVLGSRHEVSFLYQPLTLETTTRVDSDGGILIDDVTFADDTPLDLSYGFDFYRGTYRYRFLDEGSWELAAGGALQIRNASIRFDGYRPSGEEARVIAQDLGPVPVLSFAARKELPSGLFFEGTADGFYAPVRYLNLSDVDVIGWLYDAAIRVGVPVHPRADAYLSLRFLGGGADGTSGERSFWTEPRVTPRYTYNNLNLAVLSIGARVR
jgi:hypothetical protein